MPDTQLVLETFLTDILYDYYYVKSSKMSRATLYTSQPPFLHII